MTYYGDRLTTDVLASMQQMLAQVGIDFKPSEVDVPTYNRILTSKKFTMMFAGLGNGPDPDSLNPLYLSTGTLAKNFGINIPDLDKSFLAGPGIRCQQAPRHLPDRLQVMNDQVPSAFMWVQTRYGAVSKKIGNFIWTPAPGGGRLLRCCRNLDDFSISCNPGRGSTNCPGQSFAHKPIPTVSSKNLAATLTGRGCNFI